MANEFERIADLYDCRTGCKLEVFLVHREDGAQGYSLRVYIEGDDYLGEVHTPPVADPGEHLRPDWKPWEEP